MNFITHDLAQHPRLEGANTKIFLKVIDEEYTEKEVKVYRIGAEDNVGRVQWMEAIGVESIMDLHPVLSDRNSARLRSYKTTTHSGS